MELKADKTFVFGEECKAYKKAEADKVIAEKDAKILALDAEVFKQKHHVKLFFDERNYAETKLRHHARKRCLDWIEICEWAETAYNHMLEDSWQHEEKELIRKINHYKKWATIWRKLADKFKE